MSAFRFYLYRHPPSRELGAACAPNFSTPCYVHLDAPGLNHRAKLEMLEMANDTVEAVTGPALPGTCS